MRNIGIIISFLLFCSSSFSKEPLNNSISSTIPNKKYFVEQCSFTPKISLKYQSKPINIIHAEINNPIWGNYKKHPLSISFISISATTNSNILTKYNSPDYCSYATSVDVIIEIQPTIIQTTNLNNSFFTCFNKELKIREEKNIIYHIQSFEKEKYFLNRYISKLENNIHTIYSTTNQSEFYNKQISKQVEQIVNQFNSIQNQSFKILNNELNNKRNFQYISNCSHEDEYFQQFLDKNRNIIFK